MLSILVHTQSLRFAFPAFVLVGVSPHFFVSWLAWRILSGVFPRRVYEKVDEYAYDSYQSLVTYFFETYSGTKIIFYGDPLPLDKKENVVYISNHQCAVDWVVTDMMAIRQGVLGRIRYVLKSGLRYLPLYGCYFAQHGCVYVRRGGKKNDEWIRRRMHHFIKNKTPLTIKELWPYLDAVYDFTIAYRDPKKPVLPKQKSRSLTEFLSVGGSEIHIHLQRIKRENLPQEEREIKDWLHGQFAKKDKLLSHFYNKETAGRFPGNGETIVLRTRRTLPYFIFWGGLLAATLSSEKGRSFYIKSWSVMGVSSVLYMAIMYDWLQA
eukprot:Seg205.15 transcript_id=Seg205.15/GoldUCD/mRNA.D3Y31 product="1-acyl-sn-glycerol-3-phosphate acyltransferase epsilon" protein_id=Seg205.15/GoldUCD/D3Y31